MRESLFLLLVVALSYLAAHVIFERLARRFGLVSGAEYLVLGLVLGPQVSGLMPPHAVESFSPLVTLGLGWMGALVGTQLVLPRLVRIPAVRYRVAFGEALFALLGMAGIFYAILYWGSGWSESESLIVASALSLVALPASSAGVGVVARSQTMRTVLVPQLEVATTLQAVVASAGLAVLFAVLHDSPTNLARPLVPTEWMAITLAIGVVGGTLFHIFIGDEKKVDRLFISLSGAIILVSGAAAALRLSPVFAALVFGAILGNTRGNRAEIRAALSRVERPFYFALFIFAGASWRPSERDWLLLVAAFVVVRPLLRVGAARLAARMNGMITDLGPNWGRGLIGHGGFALVLALDYLREGGVPAPHVVFTATVASLLLTDVVSARLVRSVLRQHTSFPSGEYRRIDIAGSPGASPASPASSNEPAVPAPATAAPVDAAPDMARKDGSA
jgi:Kef-type K+ transport system membrane component KefB